MCLSSNLVHQMCQQGAHLVDKVGTKTPPLPPIPVGRRTDTLKTLPSHVRGNNKSLEILFEQLNRTMITEM